MWISSDAVAIVFATFAGPIGAILVAQRHEARREKRARMFRIFRILMATRKQALTPEHVEAVNLIEVDFYGVPKVENAWRQYIDHLNSFPKPDEQPAFDAKRTELLAKLIFPIGDHLNFKLSEIDIKNGGYAPDGWRYRDNRAGDLQDQALRMLRGETALRVSVSPEGPVPPTE